MTTVVNKYKVAPSLDHVYIGRGSKWGNPFSHLASSYPGVTKVATREESIERYREYLRCQLGLIAAARTQLRDKVLVCFCAPKACHGDVLARVADGGEV